jgi:aminoacyl-tRNA hydrolase
VLNADDPAVLAMAARSAAKVISYGTSPSADLRAEDIRSIWPDRLQMTLVHGAERVALQTQLCGAHWIPAVLGAVGGGLATDMTLKECAAGLAKVAPFTARMQPVTSRQGVTFIRDDFKAPLWTLDACFDFMKLAQARRKIIVIGTLSDYGTGTGAAKRYVDVAQNVQEIADVTVFVGPWASSALKARKHKASDTFRAFSHVHQASEYVNSITRDGDLVLLKGTNKQDHLLRIVLAHNGDVACWRDDCNRYDFCTECPERLKPSGAPNLLAQSGRQTSAAQTEVAPCTVESDAQVIVGLGNPESKYAGSPHNIGYEVVDLLAQMWGFTWSSTPDAWIARGAFHGQAVCLVKIRLAMNGIGAGLKRFADDTPFAPELSVVVHDDLNLPLGTVRTRLNGGAGGHRGVASVLEAFQTDAFRRVKVGIGQVHARDKQVDYVLSPWDAANRPAVDMAVRAAAERIAEMVASRPKAP